MSLYYTRILALDGIVVPLVSSSIQIDAGSGNAVLSAEIPATFAAEDIMETTHAHLWYIDPNSLSVRRRVVDLPEDAERNLNSLWAEERRRTIGEPFWPRLDLNAFGDGSSEALLRSVPYHAIRYRFGGEVHGLDIGDPAAGSARLSLQIRSYDALTTMVQAIQLIRGRGTFNEEERKFAGQQDPVFEGTGRRAFADGLTELLTDSEFGLQEGLRKLITRYAAAINPMWANRWGWTRLPNQVSTLDSDSSVERLLDTRAFREVIRETMQQSYTVPLRGAVDAVLQFMQYVLVPVPSPAYFPLRIPDQTKTVVDTIKNDRVVPAGLVADIRIGSRRIAVPPELPPGFSFVSSSRRAEISATGMATYYYTATDGVETREFAAEFAELEAFQTTTEIRGNGTTLIFEVPRGRNGGEAAYRIRIGAPSSIEVNSEISSGDVVISTLPLIASRGSEAFRSVTSDGEVRNFVAGSSYRFTFRTPLDGGVVYPPADITVLAEIRAVGERVVRELEEVPREVEPRRPRGIYPSTEAELAAVAMLPKLWWACPPACNVVIPEQIVSIQTQKTTVGVPTRILGKMAPGRSGASSVTMDKYSAPDLRELNRGIQEPGEDLRDPSELYRPEYLWGPQIMTKYFDTYSRLAAEEDWEPFLRSYLHTFFWDLRLGTRTATVVLRLDDRIVPGAPILVIRNTESSSGQSAAQRHWLDRILALEQFRRGMQACLARLGTNRGAADRLRQYIQALYAARALVEEIGGVSRYVAPEEALDLTVGTRIVTIADIEAGRMTLSGLGGAIRAATRRVRNESEDFDFATRFRHDVLDGSTASYALGVTFTAETVRSLIPGDDRAVATLTTNDLEGVAYPTFDELRRWYGVVGSNIYDPSACRAALQRDIAVVEAALADARAALRRLGVVPGPQKSFVGYVSGIQEQTAAGQAVLVVSVSHVRYISEDLDWDGLGSDDPEAVVAFGSQGFVDERYRIDRIGTDVYAPIFGCGSLADLDVVSEFLAQLADDDAEDPTTAGLPPRDGSDVSARFEHPEVCNESCATEVSNPESGLNLSVVATALIQEYRNRKAAGADSAALMAWMESIRVRPTLTMADAYRSMPVIPGGPQDAEIRDPVRGDDEVYPDGRRLRGFFYRSFLGAGTDIDRVRVRTDDEDGEEAFLELSDDEESLLLERRDRVLRYLQSLDDRTIIRFPE